MPHILYSQFSAISHSRMETSSTEEAINYLANSVKKMEKLHMKLSYEEAEQTPFKKN